MTLILGLNAWHADSAACIVRDGELVAAAEEERFRRIKHWAGFPSEAIRYCLQEAGATLADLDHIAVNRDPRAHLMKKALFAFRRRPSLSLVTDRLKNAGRVGGLDAAFAQALPDENHTATIHAIEHHTAHLASSFCVSPFAEAATVSVDGFGDFASAMWGTGSANRLDITGRVYFPHSLGLFYQAVTQYLGFWTYGDEYKVMGLAPYGRPTRMAELEKLVHLEPDGGYSLGLDYFRHHAEGVEMVWEDSTPEVGRIFTDALIDLLGPAREKDAPLDDRHKDIAASLQAMYERAFFHLLDTVQRQTGQTSLCLAGGCAMNSVANGKIFDRTGFRHLYIQSAAGDAGGAIGAAYTVWHEKLGQPRGYVPGGGSRQGYVMNSACLGLRWAAGPLGRLLRSFRNRSLRNATTNVVLCNEMRQHLLAESVPAERIRVIHNWSDPAIRPLPRSRQPAEPFTICYSGNLGRAHAVDAIIELIERTRDIPNLRWRFVGGGAGTAKLQSHVREHGIANVTFEGYAPRNQLSESLARADAHLVALDPACEGLIHPSKIYGILASGRPAIFLGAPTGSVARMLAPPGGPIQKAHGCGITLDVTRPDTWRPALQALVPHPGNPGAAARLARMAENAYAAHQRHYTREHALASWRDVLVSVAAAVPASEPAPAKAKAAA